jgi:trk system potassium uptake protein TrkA
MVAGVEGAIDVGHLVQLMGLARGQVGLSKLTLPVDNPLVGQRVCDLSLPENAALITVLRGADVILPRPDDVLEAGDEMLFVASSTAENQIRAIIMHGAPHRPVHPVKSRLST